LLRRRIVREGVQPRRYGERRHPCQFCCRSRIVKSIPWVLLALVLMPGAYAALPDGAEDGKRLHDANCKRCHDTGVYTRKNRTVHSLDALKHQVEDCGHMAGAKLSAAQTQSILNYLNQQFYQFR
jgi:mono/diheme cytochrome c family protein